MTQLDLALEFLRRFCRGEVAGLEAVLAEDLRLRGPFGHFDSRADYLASLAEDPPEEATFRILQAFEAGDRVGLFYSFEKPDVTATMAQLCTFADGRITEILLVFDSRDFIPEVAR